MPIELETERLFTRGWRPEDFDPFFAMNRDPLVRQFYVDVHSQRDSRDFVDRALMRDERDGYYFQPLIEKASGAFVGTAGLGKVDFAAAFTGGTEIGWMLRRDVWGKGYAPEMALAVLDHAFRVLALPEVVAFTVPSNARSRRVMEKLGMQHDPDGGFEHPMIPQGHPYQRQVLYRKTPATAAGLL